MGTLLGAIVRTLGGLAGWLVVILAVLVAGDAARDAWHRHFEDRRAIEDLARVQADYDARVGALRAELAAAETAWERRRVELAANARTAGTQAEASLRPLAEDLEAKARAVEARLDAMGFVGRFLYPDEYRRLKAAQADYERGARVAADALADARRTTAATLARLETGTSGEARRLAGELADVERKREAAAAALVERQRRVGDSVLGQLPRAIRILVAGLVLFLLGKLILYYAVGALAERLPPVRIRPGAPDRLPVPGASAVSLSIDLGPDEELLVDPEYLQTSGRPARRATQWVLNGSLVLSSLAAGLWLLTRIRPEPGGRTRVVVSSQRDPLVELAPIELPAGAAMVFRPRALAGVVHPAGTPVRVTKEWRLGSPHAWLTLQLRYLVFHGPCRLLVKGCRGVRAEQPDAGQPRLVGRAATLGFSPHLEYRSLRTETFVPFLRGRAALFDDGFGGGPGWFVYEELPGRDRRAGGVGQRFDVLLDAVRAPFGI